MVKYQLPIFILSAAMMGCGSDNNVSPAAPATTTSEKPADVEMPLLRQTDLKSTFRSTGAINSYVATLSWPADKAFHVRYMQKDGTVNTVSSGAKDSIEIQCENGHADFIFENLRADGTVYNKVGVRAFCPVDTVVAGEISNMDLSSTTGRLVLKDGAVIKARGSVYLTVESIEVEGMATIRSFDRDTSIKKEDSSYFEPQINIEAKRASGTLAFELNGIDGSPARDAYDSIEDFGKRGVDGEYRILKDPITGFGLSVEYAVCARQPTNGTSGTDAVIKSADGSIQPKPGPKGEDGKPSRGTVPVFLKIGDSANLNVRVDFNPGKPSLPGKGGIARGGLGGASGLQARWLQGPAGQRIVCNEAAPGTNGKDGIRGPDGSPAPLSKCGIITIPASLKGRLFMKDSYRECSRQPDIVKTY